MINHQWRRCNIHLPKTLSWGLTFLCATICWVFFRAENLQDALHVAAAMADVGNIVLPAGGSYEKHLGFLQAWGVAFVTWPLEVSPTCAIPVLFIILLGLYFLPNPLNFVNTSFRTNWKWSMAVAIVWLVGILHIAKNSPFLYFQF